MTFALAPTALNLHLSFPPLSPPLLAARPSPDPAPCFSVPALFLGAFVSLFPASPLALYLSISVDVSGFLGRSFTLPYSVILRPCISVSLVVSARVFLNIPLSSL